MKNTKKSLIEDLEKIGVEKGDCLALGVSLKRVGWLDGGPHALIEAITDVVGEQGTIFIPTHTEEFHLTRLRTRGPRFGKTRRAWQHVFDPETTPPITGAVPRALLERPDALRSRHPVHSIGAIGKFSRLLVEGHDEFSPSYSPYTRLAELGGRLLCIGLDGRLVGFRHAAQYRAGLLSILPPSMGVRYVRPDGSIGLFIQRDVGGCTKRLPELNNGFIEEGLIKRGTIGNADSLLVEAGPVLSGMSSMLKQDPTINLCDDFSCYWCREIERRLNLYPHLTHPHLYQKSRSMRTLSHALNALRRGTVLRTPANLFSSAVSEVLNTSG